MTLRLVNLRALGVSTPLRAQAPFGIDVETEQVAYFILFDKNSV